MMRGHWQAITVLLIGGALAPRAGAAQTGFNGVITFIDERSAAGKQDTFVQYSKGGKLRIEGFGGSHGAMIIDHDAKLMMMIDADKQQYMTMTDDDAKQMQAMMGPMMERMKQQQSKGADAGQIKFAKTGKTETVAGVPCEVWHGEFVEEDGKKNEGDACVATGVGFAISELTFNNPMMHGGPMQSQFEQYRQLVGDNKGILKATSVRNGKTSVQLEAIKIERKTLGNDVFAPPAGYKEIRLGDMIMQAHNRGKMFGEGQGKKPADAGKPEDTGKPDSTGKPQQ